MTGKVGNCLKNGFVANGHVKTVKMTNGTVKPENVVAGCKGQNGFTEQNHVSFQFWLFLFLHSHIFHWVVRVFLGKNLETI